MRGRRIFPDEHGNMPLEAGDYGCLEGTWWVRPPRGGVSPIPGEQVLEHEDGTISVYGPLQLRRWAGFLKRGQWTELPLGPTGSLRDDGGADGG
jgi:hypothetical protein